MERILISFAICQEAQPLKEKLAQRGTVFPTSSVVARIGGHPLKEYVFFEYGVGNGHSAANISKLASEFKPGYFSDVFIIGTAGALNGNMRVGDVMSFSSAIYASAFMLSNESSFYSKEPIALANFCGDTYRVATASRFCEESEKERLSLFADAVDMETYFVALSLKKFGYTPKVVRAISDSRFEKDSFSSFSGNLEKASSALADYMVKVLGGL